MGDGLLVRARALSFALLGLMTAVGLGLVVFISHLGWPNILGGPIPGLPAEHGAVHSRVIASHRTVPISGPSHGSGLKPVVAPAPPRTRATLVASGLSGSHKVVAPSPPPSHGNDQPSGNGAPSGSPGSQPPAAAPAPATSSPPSTVASVEGLPQSHGKGSEHHSNGDSPSASKSKAHYPVPQAPAVTARPPSPVPAGSGKDGPSPTSGETGDGNGHGHAYGHYGE